MRTLRILLLALIGFGMSGLPYSQSMVVTSNEPIVKADQAQWPPPPGCGVFSCRDKK